MPILKGVYALAAAQSMSTLINGADAGVAIISSAVAAANATLIRAHQVVGEIDGMASQFAQSPIGNIVGESQGALPCLSADWLALHACEKGADECHTHQTR